jgi:hypothetical protein
MSWKPGTILVCVDDRAAPWSAPCVERIIGMPLVAGRYYTVRDYEPMHCFRGGAQSGVRLRENARNVDHHEQDIFWGAARFRLAESGHSEAASARNAQRA